MKNKRVLKVLLVDDDEDDYFLTSELLSDIRNLDFEVVWARSYNEALRLINPRKYDLFIFDFLLGAHTGIELVEITKNKGCDEPVILLTGKGDQTIDNLAVEVGAYDYLVKSDLSPEILERSIRYSLKQADTLKALKESEKRYRTVIEQSKDLIFIADSDFNALSTSKSVEQLLGYTQEEIYDLNFFGLISDSKIATPVRDMIVAGEDVINFPVTMRSKSGEIKHCLLTCAVEASSEKDWFIHGIIIDQTDRLKAEKAMLLSEKMEATARLMRTLAHEVRNPLTNITLSVDSIESEIKDEYIQTYLEIIKRNSLRIDGLITEVLNSARQKDIELKPTPVQKVIQQAIDDVTDRAKLHGVKIITNLNDENTVLALNEDKLRIAFTNILVNAIEAMNGVNEPAIIIQTDFFNNLLALIIRDNGVGMDKEQLSRLFEPYFTTKNNGIGLGLASTLTILKAHNVDIEVDSELNRGTSFKLTFSLK
jgi:PAS domain S-box-containing protein